VSANEQYSLSRAAVKVKNKIRSRSGDIRLSCPAGRWWWRRRRRVGGCDDGDADDWIGREGGRARDGGCAVVAENLGGDDDAAWRKADGGCGGFASSKSVPITERGRAYAATVTITTPAAGWTCSPCASFGDVHTTTADAAWCLYDLSRWYRCALHHGWPAYSGTPPPWSRRGRTGGRKGRRRPGQGRRRVVYSEGSAISEFGRARRRTIAFDASTAVAAAAAGRGGAAVVARAVSPTAAAAAGYRETPRSIISVLRGRAGNDTRRGGTRRRGHAYDAITGREGRSDRWGRRGDNLFAWVYGLESSVTARNADSWRGRRGRRGRNKRI